MVWNFTKQLKAIRSRTGAGMANTKRAFFKNRCNVDRAVTDINGFPDSGYVILSTK